MSSRKLPKGTMIRCVVCDGEREAYKDCASCANKRAAGHIPPEITCRTIESCQARQRGYACNQRRLSRIVAPTCSQLPIRSSYKIAAR